MIIKYDYSAHIVNVALWNLLTALPLSTLVGATSPKAYSPETGILAKAELIPDFGSQLISRNSDVIQLITDGDC
jgi:hypothetical protein